MASDIEGEHRRPRLPSTLTAAASKTAELLVLALLLMVDFELGVRFLPAELAATDIAGALATALVATVAAVLALARRRMPARVAVATAFAVSLLASVVSVSGGSLTLSVTETAALLVLTVFGVRGESSARGAVLVGAAALVVSLAAVLLRLDGDATAVLLALLVWGCMIAGGVAGRHVRMRREHEAETHRRSERMELARELHDVVAHQVSGIVVQAQAAIAVDRTDPEQLAEAFSAIESAGTEALSGMRRMVGAIRDESDRDDPLIVPYGLADVPALIDRFDPERKHTTLDLQDNRSPVPPGVGETAYRVVREALTNVRRHAPEGTTRVSVREVDGELALDISNDGVRARPVEPDSKGFGLMGMAERVTTLGGTMRAGAHGSDCWRVQVTLPLERVR
ncbi:sensor histidine kinase [Brachybacterium sp. FME24]|uniref:sensor histidine kinase n=1 Tax=Brachybacterium sp. FME24 TaxID=2742605 RepID=UPI001867873C|nr:histidine kinase [Brachybacterium sp. FME24]